MDRDHLTAKIPSDPSLYFSLAKMCRKLALRIEYELKDVSVHSSRLQQIVFVLTSRAQTER
jgi:hypothetical protein